MQRNKISRNQLCPCGSRKKYKRCCGKFNQSPSSIDSTLEQKRLEHLALGSQRKQQQGFGRPIISTCFKGDRIVCVGKKFHSSKKWLSFHDFLKDFLKIKFGKEWWEREVKKDINERHQMFSWLSAIDSVYREPHIEENHKTVKLLPSCGAMEAYMNLSYALYLIFHNNSDEKAQNTLLERLRTKTSFQGAYYEALVAAFVIKAGFKINFEDESDPTSTHHEFTAESATTAKQYVVEAKSRHRKDILGGTLGTNNNSPEDFAHLLYKALKKNNKGLERIIFIDVNLPTNFSYETLLQKALTLLKEKSFTIKGKSAPPFYIIITNYSCHYNLNATCPGGMAFTYGFKIKDFNLDVKFNDLQEALLAKEKHRDMLDLMKSMKVHNKIPSTFDGTIPEFTFGDTRCNRLKIGHTYSMPDKEGKEIPAILTQARVSEEEKKVFGLCHDNTTGKNYLATSLMTEPELRAYKNHPNTFFGIVQPQNTKLHDPIEAYEFFYNMYKNTPAEKLLSIVSKQSSMPCEKLNTLSQEQLIKMRAENDTYILMQHGRNQCVHRAWICPG